MYWIGILAASACSFQPLRSVAAVEECNAVGARDPIALDSAQVAGLVGRFRLVQVITSLPAGRAPYIWTEGTVSLRRPTAEQLAESRRTYFSHRPRADLRLVGQWSVKGWPGQEPAELDGQTLLLGCRDCLDGSPTRLTVQGMSADRVWGRWRDDQSGNVIPVDPVSNVALKELSGPFCAARVAL